MPSASARVNANAELDIVSTAHSASQRTMVGIVVMFKSGGMFNQSAAEYRIQPHLGTRRAQDPSRLKHTASQTQNYLDAAIFSGTSFFLSLP